MNLKARLTSYILLFFLNAFLSGQVVAAQDTTTLTLQEVLDIVKKYHPVAQQANLIVDSASAVRLSVRGAFDPAFYIRNEQKTFNGSNYYFYTNPELKIPTWYGIEVKSGLEDNGGDRLSLVSTPGRSSYTGISMPLLKNLVLDKRRAALEQSKLLVKQSEADRRLAYNNLMFEAAVVYWNWVKEFQSLKVIRNAISVNQNRLELIKKSYLGGDRAAIDTIEALVQLQNFLLLETENELRYNNWSLELSNFLWLENEQPYKLPNNIIPDTAWNLVNINGYALPILEEALTLAKNNHPKLQSLGFKADALAVERRLKFQNLLPTLNVNYNFLAKGYEPLKGIGNNFFENNYKYGVEFGLPLLQRQARGEYRLSKIKIQQNSLLQSQVNLEIENKVKAYYNEILAMRKQVKILEDAYLNYLKLLRAEEMKLSIGESNLFLINSREMKAIESLQKLLETKTKFFKSLIALQWAAGSL